MPERWARMAWSPALAMPVAICTRAAYHGRSRPWGVYQLATGHSPESRIRYNTPLRKGWQKDCRAPTNSGGQRLRRASRLKR